MQRAPRDKQAADRAEHQRERQREQEGVAIPTPLPPPDDEAENECGNLCEHLALLKRVQRHDAGGNTERLITHVQNLGEQEGISRTRNLDADGAEPGGLGRSACGRRSDECKLPTPAIRHDYRASLQSRCTPFAPVGFWQTSHRTNRHRFGSGSNITAISELTRHNCFTLPKRRSLLNGT